MKDGFDLVTDVISLINVPAVLSLIDGQIWPFEKTGDTEHTEIVVNSIGVTNTELQIGDGNVNVYAPYKVTNIYGKDWLLPDHVKLDTLAKVIVPLIDTQFKDTFNTEVVTTEMIQDTNGIWFLNIKIKYYSIQNNYQNI